MALQLRRGTNANRLTITPAQGEPVYNTDTKTLYIGDGITAGGNAVSPVTTVNGLTGNVSLTTDTVGEGSHNEYFTSTRAIDAVGVALAAGTLSGLAISYNSTTHTISITNTNSVASGTSGALAYYASAGTALSASQSIVWSETGNNLNINNGNFSVIANYSNSQLMTLSTYASDAFNNVFAWRRARGTNVTPSAVQSGDTFGMFQFLGYDGSTFKLSGSIYGGVPTTVSTGIVTGLLSFSTADSTGTDQTRVRIDYTGRLIIGPYLSSDSTSGGITLRQTITSSGTSSIGVRNYFNDAFGAYITLDKFRGTYASWSTVQNGDQLGQIASSGATSNGTTSSLTNVAKAASITFNVDAAPTTGIIPGNIIFSTANSSGVLTQALKIDRNQQSTYSGNVVVNGNLTVNGTTVTVNSNVLNVEDKVINLAYTPAGIVSATGTVGTITGTGPWTATITGMTSTAGLNVGEAITATAGTGTLYGGSPSSCLVASIVSSTSITYTVTGGTIPTAGTITNITGGGPTDNTASGSGVLVYGTSNKSITWTSSATTGGSNTGYWNSTDNLNLNGSSLGYYINGSSVLTTGSILSNVTGSINVGAITWSGSGNSALIINNGALQFSSASSVAAAGTNQGTATQLYADNNFITSGTGGVILPAATTGREVSVTNNTGASINVYPQGTHTIESGGAGVPTVLPNLATISVMAKSGNNWWTIQPVYNPSNNITITQSANGTVTWGLATTPSVTGITLATSGVFTGDFDNATFANRTVFTTKTTNASTGIYAVPNGTNTAASWQALNNSNPTNASKILIATNGSTDVQLVSGINGSGTYLPLSFYNNGVQQMQLAVNGSLGFTNPTLTTSSTGTVSLFTTTTTAITLGSSTAPVTAFAATATTSSTSASLGYLGMPQQSKSGAYTTVIGDQGKHIYVTATATITIDSNANVAYPIGTTIAFIAGTGATVTIAITSDTMYLGGTGTTGSRTLAAYGMATAVKVAATTWFINGTGLT